MGNRRFLLVLVLVFALSLGIMLPGASASTLKFALPWEVPTFDMHANADVYGFVITQAIYDGLLRIDENFDVQPRLAKSWEMLDELTWRFYLREGVKFHSGNPFNAQAAKANYERILAPDEPGVQRGYIDMIDEMIVVDDYTLDIKLKFSHGAFLRHLTMPHMGILDIEELRKVGAEAFGRRPSGTGPYMLTDWQRGERIVLEKNPDFWAEGYPKMDRVEFYFVPEGSSRIMNLEIGEFDFIHAVAAHDVELLETLDYIQIFTVTAQRPIAYHVNMESVYFQDPAVRRALAHGIDKESIEAYILGAGGVALNGFVTSQAFGAIELPYEYDPEFSIALLESAGWKRNAAGIFEKDGLTLSPTVIVTPGTMSAYCIEVAEAIQMQLRRIGVDLRIDQTDWATYFSRHMEVVNDRNEVLEWDLVNWGMGIRTGDAAIPLEPKYAKDGIRNAFRYENADYETVLRIALRSNPEEMRRRAYAEAQKILYADVPAIPLFAPVDILAAHVSVSGFIPHALQVILWDTIEINK